MKARNSIILKTMLRSSQTSTRLFGVFGHAYTRYRQFYEIKHSDDDFVTLLYSDARSEAAEVLDEFERVPPATKLFSQGSLLMNRHGVFVMNASS